MRIINLFLLVLSVLSLTVNGCSTSSNSPVSPTAGLDDLQLPDLEIADGESQRTFLGSWTATFDSENLSVDITPTRILTAHWNLTTMIPAPFFQVVSYDPLMGIMEVNATISNTFNLDGYDLRLIVFNDNLGNRLMNPDAWTALYDITGGTTINPFKAYAKYVANRKFAAQTQHTERLQMFFPTGTPSVNFAIDASYPGNCEEPYDIQNFTQGILYDQQGYTTQMSIDVFDWQNDTNSVQIYQPALTGTFLPLTQSTTTTWTTTLVNSTGVSAGLYTAIIFAKSANSGTLGIYKPVVITVSAAHNGGWARTWGGTSDDMAYNLDVDPDQNVVVSGYFNNTVDFDPGPLTTSYTSNGSRNTFVSKFTQRGDLAWAKHWDMYVPNEACQVETDSLGDVYVTSGQLALRKYAKEGNILWTKTIPIDMNYGLAVDANDSVGIVGEYDGTVDFDPGPGVDQHSSVNDSLDAYIGRYDTYGDLEKAITWGGNSREWARDLIFHDYEAVYVVGIFNGTCDFDPGTGVLEKVSYGHPYGYSDAYLAKYWAEGGLGFVRTWGNASNEPPVDIAINSNNQIYVTGYFDFMSDFNPGTAEYNLYSLGYNDVYLSFFDASGNFSYALSWGGSENDRPYAITTDKDGNILVTGYFMGTVDFDPGTGVDSKTSFGSTEIFVSKLDRYGTFIWVRVFGKAGADNGFDIATDSFGNIYVCGYFMGQVDFDPGTGVEEHVSNGENDCFLLKLLPNGNWV